MKTKFILIFFIGIGFILNTCRKDDFEIPFEEAIKHEALSKEEVAFWDNQNSIKLTPSDIMLPNGLTVQKFFDKYGGKKNMEATTESPEILLNRIIAEMSETAIYLTTRSNFVYPKEKLHHRPAQNGLGYSYGQRWYEKREVPPASLTTPPPGKVYCGEDSIYGLDCSGFVHRLFKQSGITEGLWGTAEELRQPDRLKKAIKKKYPSFDELVVEDLGEKPPMSEFQSGDIIYWLKTDENGKIKAYHIGWVAYSPTLNTVAIAQSAGSPYTYGGCVENHTSEKRGPRFARIGNAIKPRTQSGFGDNYGIVRIGIETDAPDLNHCTFSISGINATYHISKPVSDYVSKDVSFAPSTTFATYKGNFYGKDFTGNYSSNKDGVDISGTIKVYFKQNYEVVDSLIWTQTSKSGFGTTTQSCKLINLKKEKNTYFYYVTGINSCANIKYLKSNYTNNYNGATTTLTKHDCTAETEIFIALEKQ